MALKYDINRIFEELEQIILTNTKNTIESPEDAPKTQEVVPATIKEREDVHGGDEASKEIKDSPNPADDGENFINGIKSGKSQISGIQSKSQNESNDYFITSNGNNSSEFKPKTTPEDLQKIIEEIFNRKIEERENFRNQNRVEYIKKYILKIIKKIAMQHSGIDKQSGSESYDKKQILQHMLKHQDFKILGDKYELKDARYVQFFIDTSGVYGCGSNKIIHELMPEIIAILEQQGYECYIAACGNGFYQRDMVEDEYFETRKTLEGYKAGKVNKIACPTPETAAQMANEAEFSIIIADFDGLSSICKMANLCQQDKKPYFLSTEDRFPWEDPTLHDWVDPDLCYYDTSLIYDVSMDGNPTLKQYINDEHSSYDDMEYDTNQYEYDD